jgi:ABC-2 type transport system permease protein
VLIARELRRLLHNPAALLTIIVAPLLLAVITSVSLGAKPEVDATIGIAGLPGGADQLATVAHGVDAGRAVTVKAISADRATALVRNGTLTAAIVVPPDPRAPVAVIGAKNEKIASEVAQSVAQTIAARRAGAGSNAFAVVTVSPGRKSIEGSEVYGPVIAVFFILFGIGAVSRGLQAQRADGTLARLLVSPIRPTVVLASKGVMMFLVGIVEIVVVIVMTTLFFGAHWGNPLGVAVVTIAIVFAGIAIALVIASIAHTPAQAQAIEFVAALLLVALGGHMVPLRNLPGPVQAVSRFTPNGATLDAYGNIAAGVGSTASQLAPLVIVFVFTLAVGLIGMSRIRRVLN